MQSLSEAANYSGYQIRISLFSRRQGRNFCEYDVDHNPLLELLQRNHNSAECPTGVCLCTTEMPPGRLDGGKNNANHSESSVRAGIL